MAAADTAQAPAQPLRALARANEIRCGHAALLQQIRARPKGMTIPRTERRTTGARCAAAIVERGREGTLEGRMRLDVLLENVPLLGPTKSDEWIKDLGVRTARKRLEELSERQRLQLAQSLRSWAARRTESGSCA